EWKCEPQDTVLLSSTWTDDFEVLFSLGSKVYLTAFDHSPACKSLFPWIAKYEKEGRNIAEQSEFRIQALRLVQTIARVLDKVARGEKLEAYLYRMGQRHVKYLEKGFKTQYWDLFQASLST
ncbi:hypothetical protein PENTCL1PPCAC_16115, partial [Pristionchus entomophagus]